MEDEITDKLTSEISRYIFDILSHYPFIIMSWGLNLHSLRADESSLQFHVQGFLHTGTVKVIYDEGSDTFVIKLYDEEGHWKDTAECVFVDELVYVLDYHIENDHPERYKDKVKSWLREVAV